MAIVVDDLSEPERRLWEAFRTGEWVDLRSGDEEADDPVGGPDWGPDRQVRAEVIAALLAGAVPVEPGSVGVLALQGAHINGPLDLSGAEAVCRLALIGCRLGDGAQADEARLRTVSFQDSVVGEVRLFNASIDGTLVLHGTHFVGPDQGLGGFGLTVQRDILAMDLVAESEIDLHEAHVGGSVRLHGARLTNPDGNALDAIGLTTQSGLGCRELVAEGRVALSDADIGGSLDLDGARLVNPGGDALFAAGLIVRGSVYCRERFTAQGMVNLRSARIGSTFEMNGARLADPGGDALSAARLNVAETAFFQGLTAEGEVRLIQAHFGALNLSGACLKNPGGYALTGDGMVVDQRLSLTDGFRAQGVVRLVGAQIRTIEDDPPNWPNPLELDGLTYQGLWPDLPARSRIAWVSRSAEGYRGQPYEQLASRYRALGHDEQARLVLLAKQRARLREQGWWRRPWGWLQDVLSGYGYAPGRAAFWLAAAFTLGWWYFAQHPPASVKGDHPRFNAALYTLDLLLPAPSLGQEDAFGPLHFGLALSAGLRIFGWVLTIAVLASLTRALSRN